MTDAEIKKIVKMTVRETKMKGVISEIYDEISSKLWRYYQLNISSPALEFALDQLRNDIYFDIIPLYYKQNCTIDAISDKLHIDASTVVRHKKRLCLEIYSMFEE